MAPEAPGNLVALDVASDESGFVCRVERYDPTEDSSSFLRVSWNAIARPPGYEPFAGGAAYVDVPPGFDHRIYEARPDIAGPRLGWIDKIFGDGLMLIAILPYGHALPSFHDADPRPVAAKPHEGRMAIYWVLTDRTRTTWRMEVIEAGRIPALCSALNQEASRQDRRPLLAPVDFVNHAATRHYPPGLRPEEAMIGFHDLCAWIGERGGDDAQISFTGVLLTFLVAADPISRWFQNYVAKRNIAVDDILSSKGFASQASLATLATAYAPSGATMRKKPWTPSAREVLIAGDALAQRVGGEGCPIGIRHLMGAYCHFHYPNHEAQLRRWGFDLDDWLSEYRKLLKTSDLSPAERAGWYALFKELGITERDMSRGPRATEQAVAAPPAGWDIFIAHAGSDKASAEQLYERLESDGYRVFLDARTLKPGDFWDLEIPHALATSRLITVLISSSYDSAHYLRAEIAQAIDQARRTGSPRVVPVYIDGPLTPGLVAPYGLGIAQAIDARAVGGLGAVADQLDGLLA
jgi:TIR domain